MCHFPFKHIHDFSKSLSSFIPCGRCIGCRLDKMSVWSGRASAEIIKGRNAFVTLTYDDFHLNFNDNFLRPSLSKVQIQNYLNNIRLQLKKYSLPFGCRQDYKYYLVGEYGDSFQRPHYHVLFFGLDFHDLKHFFEKTWHYGSVKSLPCNSATIRYVLDYMTKSVNGRYAVEQFDNQGLERPFSSCSKGFGYDYFYNHRFDINEYGMIKNGDRFLSVPPYYKNMFCLHTADDVARRDMYRLDFYRTECDRVKKQDYQSLRDYRHYSKSCQIESKISDFINHSKSFTDERYLSETSLRSLDDCSVLKKFCLDYT